MKEKPSLVRSFLISPFITVGNVRTIRTSRRDPDLVQPRPPGCSGDPGRLPQGHVFRARARGRQKALLQSRSSLVRAASHVRSGAKEGAVPAADA